MTDDQIPNPNGMQPTHVNLGLGIGHSPQCSLRQSRVGKAEEP